MSTMSLDNKSFHEGTRLRERGISTGNGCYLDNYIAIKIANGECAIFGSSCPDNFNDN